MASWIELPAPSIAAADALTALADAERPFLLEGSPQLVGDGLGRFSFAGCEPRDQLVVDEASSDDAWLHFSAWLERHRAPIAAPAIVGFATYEAGRLALGLPTRPSELGLPLHDWAYYGALFRRDEASGECVVLAADRPAGERLLRRLQGARPAPPVALPQLLFSYAWSDEVYLAKVVKVIDYLVAGDAYQVNLTQQLRAPLEPADALAAYLRVRRDFQAPLGGYLASRGVAILGNSPELLLRRRGAHAESRPIKGTRRRDADAAQDQASALLLQRSAKDAAEHVMIVDLVRHDLGALAETGSVHVEQMMRLLTLPTVHHLVSTVCAEVPETISTARLLAALLPGGSVTGAPKRRAVEIIDELEGRARGVYCGAFGWIAPNGDCDLALPIRTAVATRGEFVLGIGGGIVVDSEPEAELAECRLKAAAFLRALGGSTTADPGQTAAPPDSRPSRR